MTSETVQTIPDLLFDSPGFLRKTFSKTAELSENHATLLIIERFNME